MFYKVNPSRKPKQRIARQLFITVSLGDGVPGAAGLTDAQVIEFMQDIQTALSARHKVEVEWQRLTANTARVQIILSPQDERSGWFVRQLRSYLHYSINFDLLIPDRS
ncbi:MAG TPA: hypothetical protein VNG90_05735 [Candidatus Acidoferrum sp.]|nr:hypothetical protein [Candidatus Acidoferrum sp.]